MTPYRVRPIARWLTLATIVLILYGSLFPFGFGGLGERGLVELIEGLRFRRTSRGDVVANLLLYMPLGLGLVLACPGQWRRATALACAILLGSLLSVAVEILQVYTSWRVSSLSDVVINATGTLAGGVGGILYLGLGTTLRIPGVVVGRPEPVPLGVLLLWLAFRLAPFVPTIDWQKYKDALKPLFLEPQIDGLATFRYLVGWLVVGYAVRLVWQRDYVLYALFMMVALVLGGRVVIVGNVLVASELLALALCIPAAAFVGAVLRRRSTSILAALLVATIVLQGLEPFELAAETQQFSWVPFANSLGDSMELNYSVLLEKCFWYFSLVWLLTRSAVGVSRAAMATAALVGAIEVLQLWLPGRSAEVTDPLLALISGGLCALLGAQSLGARDNQAELDRGGFRSDA